MQYIFSFVHIYVNTCVSGYLSYPYDIVPIRAGFAVCCTWVKQRNSGLDAWESTQLQATDLGTASCLRYFRQSIGSREHPDQTVVLGFLRFPADDPRNQFWKTEGLTLPKLREWRPEINSYPRFSMSASSASARKIHIWNWSESQGQQRWAK